MKPRIAISEISSPINCKKTQVLNTAFHLPQRKHQNKSCKYSKVSCSQLRLKTILVEEEACNQRVTLAIQQIIQAKQQLALI